MAVMMKNILNNEHNKQNTKRKLTILFVSLSPQNTHSLFKAHLKLKSNEQISSVEQMTNASATAQHPSQSSTVSRSII
jgi:hypothetical protein